MEDFYFAYGYDSKNNKAIRLYRFKDGEFERYNPREDIWKPSPDRSIIFTGDECDYDEISESEALGLKVLV